MNTPEISVIIPAYNAGSYLIDSITSVLKQSFTLWELIIVDDGSTDNTPEVVNQFLSDVRIKLISQPNKGVSAARNTGINASRGRFITFLDADDSYYPTNLQEKYELLKSNDVIDFVYSDSMRCDEKLNDLEVEEGIEPTNLFEKVLQWQGETIPSLSSNIMVKSALMKEKFLFDEHLSNCADRYMKIMLAKNLTAAYVPKTLIKYRDAPGSMSKKVWLLEKDELYIANKIIQEKIIPPGKFRRMVIANMYFIVSGSWYKIAGKPIRAFRFALKAIFTYPPILLRFLKKTPKLTGIKGKP